MKDYFYSDGENQLGPFSLENLKTKSISKESLIWHDELDDWTKASDLEELKDMFKISPPPLNPINVKKEIKTPPVIKVPSEEVKSNSFSYENKEQPNNNYKYILIGLGVILLGFFIFRLVERTQNDAAIEKQEAVQSAIVQTEKAIATQEEIKNQAEQELAIAEKNQEEERSETINSLNNVKEEVSNVSWGAFGGASGIQIKINNPTKLSFKFIKVQVSYIKESGGLYKTEEVIFYDVTPYSSQIENAPDSDRGTKLQTSIIEYESPDVPKDLL